MDIGTEGPFTINERGQTVDEDGFMTSSFTKRVAFGHTCVAVKVEDGTIQVRDTKDPEKTTLSFNQAEWDAFIKGVKNGEFDLPA